MPIMIHEHFIDEPENLRGSPAIKRLMYPTSNANILLQGKHFQAFVGVK